MKLNKYIGIAVMPMLFAACQNDVLDEGMQLQEQPIYTLSGKMDKGVNSRAQIQLGNPDESGEIFMWNEGDSFNLYQGGAETQVTFNISSDYSETAEGDKSTATFSSDIPVYPGNYVAVYPTVPVENNRFVFEFQRSLDFSGAVTQEEKDAVWREYFKNNMFMIARGELTTEGPNAIQFQHQCALARITYHNESGSDQVLDYIRLGGQNQYWGTWSKQNMDGTGGSGSMTSWYDLQLNGLQVAAGESTDFYIFFFPTELNEDGIVQIYFSVQGRGERGISLPAADIAAVNGGAKRFQAGMRYWFDVTATKGGAVLSKNYSTAPITFENVEFAAALQKVLGQDMITIDPETGVGTMIEADVLGITDLDFGQNYCKMTSLKGIENFKNLISLSSRESGITECDLSQNVNLQWVDLAQNSLTSMDFSQNSKLYSLDLSHNQDLTSLNIDQNEKLERLIVSETGLTSLNIPNKEGLWMLRYGRTALSFDLNEFPKLTYLSVYDLNLTSLDLIPSNIKAQLEFFECYDNEISSIDLKEFPNLRFLACYFNPLKSLDLTPVPHLQELNCHSCYIDRLDITPLENLNTLYCGNQYDNINLILIATDAQKDRWRNYWSKPENTWNLNDRAYLEGEEPVEIPGGSGTGNDFNSGGEF